MLRLLVSSNDGLIDAVKSTELTLIRGLAAIRHHNVRIPYVQKQLMWIEAKFFCILVLSQLQQAAAV